MLGEATHKPHEINLPSLSLGNVFNRPKAQFFSRIFPCKTISGENTFQIAVDLKPTITVYAGNWGPECQTASADNASRPSQYSQPMPWQDAASNESREKAS